MYLSNLPRAAILLRSHRPGLTIQKALFSSQPQSVPTTTSSTTTVKVVEEPTTNKKSDSSSFRAGAEANAKQRRPVGAVRGGIIGLLLGLSIAGGTGYYYLLDEYQISSNALLSTVEKLQTSVSELKSHTTKVVKVEQDLKELRKVVASSQQLENVRNELLMLIDALTVEHLETKTRVWQLEQDSGDGKK
ncbi:hypothetical protein BKA69DRAFT_1069093 [Paraphysoderma sedebokerense]|nr:hypothetical protein BKA69DRAFT_1069093 [Paraphysoderma sedebokerense]